MPKISVIVPVYKVEKYLHRCVDSILNQSFTDFELILVDDGSPDNCPQICDEYAKKDNRIIVIHKENGGLSDARNKGIDYAFENSNSEWLTFIDSDDWIHKDYLKYLYESCIENNVDISVCNFERTECEKITDKNIILNSELWITEDFYFKKQVNATIAWGKLYKKYLFENIRYPYGKLHEDEFTTYKLLFQLKKIVYITEKLYYYYQNPDSITNKIKNINIFQNALEAIEEQIMFFKNEINNNKSYNFAISLYFDIYLKILQTSAKNFNKIEFIKEYKKRKQTETVFSNIKISSIYYNAFKNSASLIKNIKILYILLKKTIIFLAIKYNKYFLLRNYKSK